MWLAYAVIEPSKEVSLLCSVLLGCFLFEIVRAGIRHAGIRVPESRFSFFRRSFAGVVCLVTLFIACYEADPENVLAQSAYAAVQSNSWTPQSANPGPGGGVKREKAFSADERVTVGMPDHSVELAQPIQLPVYLKVTNVVSLTVVQHSDSSVFRNQRAGVVVGSGEAKVVHDEGVTRTIEITPLQTGAVIFEVDAIFSDGGMSHKSYQLNVVASSKGLKKFYLNHGSKALALVLEDKDEDRQWWLEPEVYYDQLDYPIYLADSTQVKFTVSQPESDPVIRVDSSGMVHALRTGRARILADFDGVMDDVTVEVYTKENAPAGYRRVRNATYP